MISFGQPCIVYVM